MITDVETMCAVRKLARDPGLVVDEVPVAAPREDEVLARVEAASVCGTDLHIHRYDAWAARRVEAFDLLASGEACTIVRRPGAAS